MFKEFICGVLTVSELGEPDWGEVAARLGLTQQLMEEDATFKFMSAIKNDEGAWQVPFLAYGSMGPEFVKEPISRFCPYELARVSAVRPGRMPLDRLEDLRELVKGAMGPVSASDLAGRAAACPRPEGGEEVFSGLVGMEEQRLMLMKLGTAVAKHGRGAVDCLHFVFEGNPLSVAAADREKLDYVVLDTETAENTTEVQLQVLNATGYAGIAADKLLLAAEIDAPLQDADRTEYAAVEAMARCVVEYGPLAGFAAYNIAGDYYHADRNYSMIREAIQTLNPSK